MSDYDFYNVEDVFNAARLLRDRLDQCKESEASDMLEETMSTFWTTSSEAVGELRVSLLDVRPIVMRVLDKDSLDLLDGAVAGIGHFL